MKKIYVFGPFRVDLIEEKLWEDGRLHPVTPKVFHTLAILLQNRERVVSKRELLDAVWPDCNVGEANLPQNISVLRKSLGEPESGAKYIATFPRQGYRFVAEVRELAAEPVSAPPVSVSNAKHRGRMRQLWLIGLLVLVLAALELASLGRTPRPIMMGERHTITHLPGRVLQPVIAPAGKTIAFVYIRDLRSPLRVEVITLGQSGEPRMIGDSDGDSFSPAFSPDGRDLAYLQARGNKVFVMLWHPDGPPREVAEVYAEHYGIMERLLDWSPDGSLLAVCDKSANEEPFRIELIQIAEGRKIPLTTPPPLTQGDFDPRFSPDGKQLAFMRLSSTLQGELFVVSMPGGDPRPLTTATQSIGGLDWMPDSGRLLVSADKGNGPSLWYVSAARGAKDSWQLAATQYQDLVQLSVGRQTGRVVTASSDLDENIWRARLEPKQGVLDWRPFIESPREDFSPAFSPNGRQVAFLSYRSGTQQLWIKDEDREPRQLTFGHLAPLSPAWTGKGDEVVFSSPPERQMYRIVAKGGSPVRIPVDGGVAAHTTVSPDENYVYMVRRFYIFQAPFTGGQPRLVTSQGGFPLRMSPGGEWIYYVRDRFSNEIWRARSSNGHSERVTDRLQPGCWACWSVNASSLAYVAKRKPGEPAQLERMDLATGNYERIGEFPGRLPRLGRGGLTMNLDGSSLLAVVAEPSAGNLDLIESSHARQ